MIIYVREPYAHIVIRRSSRCSRINVRACQMNLVHVLFGKTMKFAKFMVVSKYFQ